MIVLYNTGSHTINPDANGLVQAPVFVQATIIEMNEDGTADISFDEDAETADLFSVQHGRGSRCWSEI